MYSVRAFTRERKLAPSHFRRAFVTEADVQRARDHCRNKLRCGDYDAYLIRQFVPKSSQDAYDALRTLNLELARLPETVSNPAIGRFRMQFWRDTVNKVFDGAPPREPISILLHQAIASFRARAGESGVGPLKFWLLRLIDTRERHMDNRPFASLSALEDYAENTYSTLMYMTLGAMTLQSVNMDHLASHIGKACGIVATLRGIPILAAPSRPARDQARSEVESARNLALLLPLDVMAEVGVKEEDVFRKGPGAVGLQDAVFKVATRANDHLLTAREMLKSLRAGNGPGHEYEHQGETGHLYTGNVAEAQSALTDLQRGFGVLLEAVPTAEYLTCLESANFDPYKVKSCWKLPWRIWQALKRQQI